jgi:hypothetical protein
MDYKCRNTAYTALQLAANAFLKHHQPEFAQEVLLKLEDWPALVQLHCSAEAWDRAFMTVKRCPEEEPGLYEVYAEWLVSRGRYGDPLYLESRWSFFTANM